MGKLKQLYKQKSQHKTSWQKVAPWYEKLVGDKGHYFHSQIILPNTLRLLSLKEGVHVLDIGCGQGVLERALPKGIKYTGIDVAVDLVDYAGKHKQHEKHEYIVADATETLEILPDSGFERVALILSLQNMANWEGVFDNIARLLKPNGKAVMVMNHPAFRIPRQTAWGDDEQNKQQYRKVYRYMSTLEIPISMDPGKGGAKMTWSYHRPLSDLVSLATERNLVVSGLEEWTSDKTSEGLKAKSENRARQEIPLFMAVVLEKRN